jgi:hypothetical protein
MKFTRKEIKIMKRQIRRGVFETNSSSTHSLTMCSKSEYDEFEKGNMYIERWGSKLYTKEEMIEKFKQITDWRTKELKYRGVDWDNDEEFNRVLEETDYVTHDKYWDTVSEEYETFEDSYTGKDGDTVIAFGYYGYN